MLRIIFLLLVFQGCYLFKSKFNVCKTNEAYRNYDPNECSYNPTIGASVIEMIITNGFLYTTHQVVTVDGYILNFFRIFKDGERIGEKVIYFQHGLMSDAGNFLTDGKSSLAFRLVEHGFDVFLGNSRGTPYSRDHKNSNITHKDYWNFSFEEISIYDLPATLEEISKITGSNSILYLGHSMGGAISAIYAIENKRHAKKYVKAFINIAPVVYLENYDSPISYLAKYLKTLRGLLRYSGIHGFNDKKFLQSYLIKFCSSYPTVIACTKMLDFTLGNGSNSRRSDIVPILASQLSSASMKSIYHYLQILQSKGKFSKYDYGWRKNYILYGTYDPPQYNVSDIDMPTYIFYSTHDILAKEQYVRRFYNTISSLNKSLVRIPQDDSIVFNHHDFWGSDNIEQLFHKPLLRLIDKLYN